MQKASDKKQLESDPAANKQPNTTVVQPTADKQVPANFSIDKSLGRVSVDEFLKGNKQQTIGGGGYEPKATPSQDLYINKAANPSPLQSTEKKLQKKKSPDEKLFDADLRSMVSPKEKNPAISLQETPNKKIDLWDPKKIKQKKEEQLKEYLMKEGFTPTDVSKVLLPGKRFEKMHELFKLTIQYKGDILRAMKDVGYTAASQVAASRIIKSYSWNKLLDVYFPPHLLMETGRELLENKDWRAKDSQLDRIHKLRGDFVKHVEIKVNPSGDLSNSSNEELLKILEEDNIIDQENDG